MTIYDQAGLLILGTRLRNLSDRYLSVVQDTYRTLDIPFEASWFPLFFLLSQRSRISMAEAAQVLPFSHSAVSQMAGSLRKKGLLVYTSDASDGRRKQLMLSKDGQKILEQAEPVWQALRQALVELLGQRDVGTCTFNDLEEALNRPDIVDLIVRRMDSQEPRITVIPHSYEHLADLSHQPSGKGTTIYGCFLGQRLAGYLEVTPEPEELILHQIWVEPVYRRQGLATMLAKHVSMAYPGLSWMAITRNPSVLTWMAATIDSFTVQNTPANG